MLPAGLLAVISASLLPANVHYAYAAKTPLNVTFPNASTSAHNFVNDNFLGISFELSPFNTLCTSSPSFFIPFHPSASQHFSSLLFYLLLVCYPYATCKLNTFATQGAKHQQQWPTP